MTEPPKTRSGDAVPLAIGVDIGGTRWRAGVVDVLGRVQAHEVGVRPEGATRDAFGDALLAALDTVVGRLGPQLPVGIGVAAMVDADGTLVAAPNLPAAGLDLARRAQQVLDVPVRVVNDATAACLAEARVGAAAGCRDVVLLTVGTGVGGGAMIDGRVLTGATGLAAEFGHLVVADGGRSCPCGNHGCLEAYASGRAIAEMAAEALAGGRHSRLLSAAPVVDGPAVADAADAGDRLAGEIIDEAGRWLGVGVATLVNALDPAVVVIGGGAGHALRRRLLPVVRTAMATRVFGRGRRVLPPVRPARLGDDAGLVGAALLAADLNAPTALGP